MNQTEPTIQLSPDKKSTQYQKIKLYFSIISAIINLIVPVIFLISGGSEKLRNLSLDFGYNYHVTILIYVIIFSLGLVILHFPFDIFSGFIFFSPNILGHPDNYIEANPLITPKHIVPEWYFLPFYAILRAIPFKLLGVLAMLGSIFILFVLPWLDTCKVRSCRFRPIYKQFYWIFIFNFIVLGWVGSKVPEGHYLIISRICTTYYFAHFLIILPILGKFEKTLPVPLNIFKTLKVKKK